MKCIVLPPMFKNTREVVLVVAALRSPEHPEHFLPRFGFPDHDVRAWHCKNCGYVVTDPPLRGGKGSQPEV